MAFLICVIILAVILQIFAVYRMLRLQGKIIELDRQKNADSEIRILERLRCLTARLDIIEAKGKSV